MATELIDRPAEQISELTLRELAEQANEAASDAEECASSTVEAAIRCGILLIAAKAKVKHGTWQSWVAENFSKGIGQARRYMSIAKEARALVLTDASSIRDALRRIAGPKEGSDEHKEEQMADMLRAGATQQQVIERFHVQNPAVKRIYEEIVMPELLEVDWRSVINKALVKEIAAARMKGPIEAEYQNRGLTGGAMVWAASEAKVSEALLLKARKVLASGCPSLVARAEAGEISLTAAAEIAKLPADRQAKELATLDRKKTIDVIDDLRSRVSVMLDQKLGWSGQYTSDPDVFRDLRDNADSAEVAEIVRNLLLVRDWVATITSLLGEGQCSQQTNEQQRS